MSIEASGGAAEDDSCSLEAFRKPSDEGRHPASQGDERRVVARTPGGLRGQPAKHAPVLDLERPERRERRRERELLAVTTVDPGHERLDDCVVRLTPEPPGDESRDRLVVHVCAVERVDRCGK